MSRTKNKVSDSRLRYILHQLDRGELTQDDLRKNLEYAALVLETAYMDDSRYVRIFAAKCPSNWN